MSEAGREQGQPSLLRMCPQEEVTPGGGDLLLTHCSEGSGHIPEQHSVFKGRAETETHATLSVPQK